MMHGEKILDFNSEFEEFPTEGMMVKGGMKQLESMISVMKKSREIIVAQGER